jgi:hypothetical protein
VIAASIPARHISCSIFCDENFRLPFFRRSGDRRRCLRTNKRFWRSWRAKPDWRFLMFRRIICLAELLKREELGSTGMGGGGGDPACPISSNQQAVRNAGAPEEADRLRCGRRTAGRYRCFLLVLAGRAGRRTAWALWPASPASCRNPATIAALRSARDGAEIYRTLDRRLTEGDKPNARVPLPTPKPRTIVIAPTPVRASEE